MTDDRTRWMVLLHEDENAWATATPEQQDAYLDRHRDYEAASQDAVVDHARRLPPSYTIEVRPVAIIDS